jgi:hypothetical protein
LPNDDINLFFRIILFKLFNKIETWEHLEKAIGPITWENFDYRAYDRVLSKRMNSGERNYSAAYIMPSGNSFFGFKLKHQNHLAMLEFLIENQYPARFIEAKNMKSAFALLLTVPFVGPFLAYQYATDLNYSELTKFSEDEFVVAGPGAMDGIHKCFLGAGTVSPDSIIRYVWEHQDEYFSRLEIDFPTLWGRPLQLIDCQNLFCEISKYARVAFPEFKGVAGRTRIKQTFEASAPLPSPWYPPKWGLNCRIAA